MARFDQRGHHQSKMARRRTRRRFFRLRCERLEERVLLAATVVHLHDDQLPLTGYFPDGVFTDDVRPSISVLSNRSLLGINNSVDAALHRVSDGSLVEGFDQIEYIAGGPGSFKPVTPSSDLPDGRYVLRVKDDAIPSTFDPTLFGIGSGGADDEFYFTIGTGPLTATNELFPTNICERNVGTAEFGMGIHFSEPMDHTVPLTISFSHADAALRPAIDSTFTYNSSRSGWLDADTFEAYFDVADVDVTAVDALVQVAGGRSVQGKTLAEPLVSTFMLDTQGPVATIDVVADPTASSPVRFSLQFSEEVVSLTNSDLAVSGTAFDGVVPTIQIVGLGPAGAGPDYEVRVTGMNQSGTVALAFTGSVADSCGNPSGPAIVVDDSVLYDAAPPTSTMSFPSNLQFYNASGWTVGGMAIGGTYSDPGNPPGGRVQLTIGRGDFPNLEYWNGSNFTPASIVHDVAVTSSGSWSFPFWPPDDGRYFLSFTAIDAVGHRESTQFAAFTYDTTAPASSIVQTTLDASTKSIRVSLAGTDTPDPFGLFQFELQIYKLPDGSTNFVRLSPDPRVFNPLPPITPEYSFAAESNTLYYIRSVAIDLAGNREQKTTAQDRRIYVPDIHPPSTHVESFTLTSGSSGTTLGLPLSGMDQGSGLKEFEVWAQVDTNAWSKLPAPVPAGSPNAAGEYQASAVFQALPGDHIYRFYSVGVDHHGNREDPPSTPGYDVETSAISVPLAASSQVTGFDVQRNQDQRSHVQLLDVVFNRSDILDDILNNFSTRVHLQKHDYDGNFLDLVDLTSVISRNSNMLSFDFGSSLDDGFYRLKFDLDGDGIFDGLSNGFGDSLDFFRMLGDGSGDGTVDSNDKQKDLNGDGRYDNLDVRIFGMGYRKNRGTAILGSLLNGRDD